MCFSLPELLTAAPAGRARTPSRAPAAKTEHLIRLISEPTHLPSHLSWTPPAAIVWQTDTLSQCAQCAELLL